MFELTYEVLRNPAFNAGVKKVLNSTSLKDVKKIYNIARIGALLEQAHKDAAKVFEQVVKAHGNVKGDGTFTIDDDKIAEWEKAHAEFLNHRIQVERHKIRVEDVSDLLTPLEMLAMEPMLDGLDTLDGESTS